MTSDTPTSKTCAIPIATCTPHAPDGTACNADIDAIIWHGGNVQHSLTADAGYTMSLELESQLPEDTLEELVTAATTLAPSPGTETQKPGNNARSLPATRLGRSG